MGAVPTGKLSPSAPMHLQSKLQPLDTRGSPVITLSSSISAQVEIRCNRLKRRCSPPDCLLQCSAHAFCPWFCPSLVHALPAAGDWLLEGLVNACRAPVAALSA